MKERKQKVAVASLLADRQVKNPKRFLAGAALFTLAAFAVAAGIKFDSSYEALLPDDSAEINNANVVRDKTGGTRQVVVAIEGSDKDQRRAFARKVTDRFRQIEDIRYADFEFPIDFFKKRALRLMDETSLDELTEALEEAVRAAKWKANPMNLRLDEEKDEADLKAAWKRVEDLAKSKNQDMPFNEIIESKDGKYTFVLVTPRIKFEDIEVGRQLYNRMNREIEDLNPKSAGVEVTLAGNLSILQEQNRIMLSDLRNASFLAFIAGIILIALALRRLGAPFLIGAALLCGVTWTFAFARIAVGHVNIITGFLVSVIIGLGIDFGIHLFMRVQQDIKFKGLAPEDAVREAVISTFPPALTSALTTAGTFLSFMIADFRGFSEFGLIAGIGVLLTLTSSFLVLPPLLLVFGSKRQSVASSPSTFFTSGQLHPGLAGAAVSITLALVIVGITNVNDIPFRNNFRELRGKSPATEFADYVDRNMGTGFNPAVFIVKNTDDAKKIKDLAQAQQKNGFNGRPSRIGKILSASDLLPQNQAATESKIEHLKKILNDPKLDRAEEIDGEADKKDKEASSKQAEDLRQAREMANIAPWTMADLPEVFSRRVITQNGKEYMVYIWPEQRNDSDIQAASWDDELNYLSKTAAEAGIENQSADETLVLAWIYKTILKDGVPLLVMAAVVVFIFLLIDFRKLKPALLIGFTLACGMSVFAGLIHLLKMEINMFNLIVLPSVVGIGVDNAVHIYHRYMDEGLGSLKRVLRTTGAAALMASLTTAFGFGAGIISHNVGLQSLGSLAVVGIASVFTATTIFFPGFLSLLERIHKS